jgi:hypothetical protein
MMQIRRLFCERLPDGYVPDTTEGLQQLFTQRQYQSIDELIVKKEAKTKKRGRKNG